MATTEQLIRAQAAYRGEDPDAAWAAFGGAPAPTPAPAPPVAPDPVTSSAPITADDINARFNAAAEPYGVGARLPVEQPSAPAPMAQAGAETAAQEDARLRALAERDYAAARTRLVDGMEPPERRVAGGGGAQTQTAESPAQPLGVVAPRPLDPGQKPLAQAQNTLRDFADASLAQQKAIADGQAAIEKASAARTALVESRNKDLGEQLSTFERDSEAYNQLADAQREKFRKLNEEISQRAQNVGDRRTQQERTMGIIATALAGLGDAISAGAGRNTSFQQNVLDGINRAVDRDIALQQYAIDNMRGEAQGVLTELGMARDAFNDKNAAREYVSGVKQLQYANSMEQLNAGIQNAQLRQQNDLAIAVVRADSAMKMHGALMAESQEQRLRGGGGGGGRKPMTVAEQIALERLNMDREKWEAEKNKGAGAGGTAEDIPGYKRTKEVSPAIVTEATKASAAVTGLNNGLDQLSALRDEYLKTGVTETGKRTALANQARQIIGNYADTASQLAGGGQAGEAAKQQAMEDIPDPTQWDLPGRVDPKAIYQGLKVQNRQTADAKLRSMGYEPMDDAPVASPPSDDGTKVRVRTNGIETTIPRANLATAQKLGAEVVGEAEQAQASATVRVRSLRTGQLGNMPAAQAAAAAKAGRVEIVQ